MKKLLLMLSLVVTFFLSYAVSASAVTGDTIAVGLRYGSTALFSANLENAEGKGYHFGFYDGSRSFQYVGETEETAISMTGTGGTIYLSSGGAYSSGAPAGSYTAMGSWHILLGEFDDFEDAYDCAEANGGYVAWINGAYQARYGCYESQALTEEAMYDLDLGIYYVQSASTGVLVTVTRTDRVIFEFDGGSGKALGVEPQNRRADAVTWFKGYRYNGGFSYPRSGSNLTVINMVDVEQYVQGVIAYEMSPSWPSAALEAQAVCARTYACAATKHKSAGFDVCSTTDCQVYYGRGTSSSHPTDNSDQAVLNTAGEVLYYGGSMVKDAVYCASNGGATEDAANVWGSTVGYLIGKKDPYEAMITIPNYSWSVTYTPAQLTWILDQKGYSVGTVQDVFVSKTTAMGNVAQVTVVGSSKTRTFNGDSARTIFGSATYGKYVNSLRYTINGGAGSSTPVVTEKTNNFYVNSMSKWLAGLKGASVISGSGKVSTLTGTIFSAITSRGVDDLTDSTTTTTVPSGSTGATDSFTFTGTGNGHNVGLSQYGAKAMAENGYDYEDILKFYYTDVTIGWR